MTRNIDELNNLNRKAEDPVEYFKKMNLPEAEKERRVEYTKKANEIFDLILVLILLSDDRSSSFFLGLRERLETYLLSLISEYTQPDDYLIDYATDTAYNFVDTTEKHIDEEWYASADRALYNAENGANDVLNYDLYQKAIAEGKTHKKWITEKDLRVRKTHRPLDGKTIGIKELFYVGGVPMRFPKDYEYAEAFPQELINCRCSIEYLDKGEKFKDVTNEYLEKANPGFGMFYEEPGFEEKNGETNTAKWLYSNFGGDISLLAENNPDGTSNPDFLWKNKLWDLKTPEQAKGVDRLTRKGLHQIARNSGGLIIDTKLLNLPDNEIEEMIKKRTLSSAQDSLDIIIKQEEKLKKILRYKKVKE